MQWRDRVATLAAELVVRQGGTYMAMPVMPHALARQGLSRKAGWRNKRYVLGRAKSTLKYSWVKTLMIYVHLQILFVTLQNVKTHSQKY